MRYGFHESKPPHDRNGSIVGTHMCSQLFGIFPARLRFANSSHRHRNTCGRARPVARCQLSDATRCNARQWRLTQACPSTDKLHQACKKQRYNTTTSLAWQPRGSPDPPAQASHADIDEDASQDSTRSFPLRSLQQLAICIYEV